MQLEQGHAQPTPAGVTYERLTAQPTGGKGGATVFLTTQQQAEAPPGLGRKLQTSGRADIQRAQREYHSRHGTTTQHLFTDPKSIGPAPRPYHDQPTERHLA